jgi:hypothetical protein
MSLTYGTVLTEGFGWAPATVGLVNVSWDSHESDSTQLTTNTVRYPSRKLDRDVLGRMVGRQDQPLAR